MTTAKKVHKITKKFSFVQISALFLSHIYYIWNYKYQILGKIIKQTKTLIDKNNRNGRINEILSYAV